MATAKRTARGDESYIPGQRGSGTRLSERYDKQAPMEGFL